MEKLTQKRLKELLRYDPNTGIFTRLSGYGPNAPRNGVAGSLGLRGYTVLSVVGKRYTAHRLVWLYTYGYFPEHTIDHINRVKTDNRLSNLREASRQCNARNMGLQSNNTSGVKGVVWDISRKRWSARIKVSGATSNLGRYKDKSDAVMARWKAEKEHNFPNCCSDSSAYKYLIDNKIINQQ